MADIPGSGQQLHAGGELVADGVCDGDEHGDGFLPAGDSVADGVEE